MLVRAFTTQTDFANRPGPCMHLRPLDRLSLPATPLVVTYLLVVREREGVVVVDLDLLVKHDVPG